MQYACINPPRPISNCHALAFVRDRPRCALAALPIAECAEQRTYKSGDHKKMTQSPGPQMFSYELCIQPGLKLLFKIQKRLHIPPHCRIPSH